METDEVYAQMTLQPLNPVRRLGFLHDVCSAEVLMV